MLILSSYDSYIIILYSFKNYIASIENYVLTEMSIEEYTYLQVIISCHENENHIYLREQMYERKKNEGFK